MTTRFEVHHLTICDGWINCWSDGDGNPTTYATRQEAEADIVEFLDAVNEQIARGERDPESGYSPEHFKVVEIGGAR